MDSFCLNISFVLEIVDGKDSGRKFTQTCKKRTFCLKKLAPKILYTPMIRDASKHQSCSFLTLCKGGLKTIQNFVKVNDVVMA